jgi:hypothetical protein
MHYVEWNETSHPDKNRIGGGADYAVFIMK